MKKTITVLSLLLLGLSPLHADDTISASKQAEIMKLLELTGAIDIGKQMGDALGGQFSQAIAASNPDVTPEVAALISEIASATTAENMDGLIERIVPIYDRYYSEAELVGLNEFYQTPLGQKMIQTLPGVMQDSMQAGMQWSQELGPLIAERVQQRLEAEGIDQ